jgi:hypothetical protein
MTSDKELEQTSDKLDKERRELDESADSLSKKKRQHETTKATARKMQAQIEKTLEKLRGEGVIPAAATITHNDMGTDEKYQVRLVIRDCLLVFLVDADEGIVRTNCYVRVNDSTGAREDVGITTRVKLDEIMAEDEEFVRNPVNQFLKEVVNRTGR